MFLQNIQKNQAFRLYFSALGQSTGEKAMLYDQSNAYVRISKDGASIITPENSCVFLGTHEDVRSEMWYIDLTAEDMNADVISVNISLSVSGIASWVTIYTGTVIASTTQSPTVMTSIAKAVNLGYTVTQVETGENGYNYYGLVNGGTQPWWMIIREKTDFTDIGYKMNKENRQTFANGWANRATLNYSTDFPLN